MQVSNIPITELKPFAKNPKKHPENQMQMLKKSMKEFGWTNPILIADDNMVVAGHARLQAATELGFTEVPVIKLDMPYEKAVAYVIADNRLAELAETDNILMQELLSEVIKLEDFDFEATGYTVDDLDEIIAAGMPAPEIVEDEPPEPPEELITVRGDIWELGNHRLMCGDSTDKHDMSKLLGNVKPDMLFTDPPYGVSYADKNAFLNVVSPANRIQKRIENDHASPGDMSVFWNKVFTLAHDVLRPGACYYVTGPQGGDLLLLLLQSLFESGLLLKHMLIWVKNNHVLGRCDYNYKHEPIIYGWKDGGHKFYGGGGAVSVWEIDKPHRSDLHPTMKPVELVVRAIENSTTKKETVLDMFLGSGTTLVACEQTGRTCYGNELDPHYCDVIVQRYVNFTGNRELKRNGEPYIWQADQKEQQK